MVSEQVPDKLQTQCSKLTVTVANGVCRKEKYFSVISLKAFVHLSPR